MFIHCMSIQPIRRYLCRFCPPIAYVTAILAVFSATCFLLSSICTLLRLVDHCDNGSRVDLVCCHCLELAAFFEIIPFSSISIYVDALRDGRRDGLLLSVLRLNVKDCFLLVLLACLVCVEPLCLQFSLKVWFHLNTDRMG